MNDAELKNKLTTQLGELVKHADCITAAASGIKAEAWAIEALEHPGPKDAERLVDAVTRLRDLRMKAAITATEIANTIDELADADLR